MIDEKHTLYTGQYIVECIFCGKGRVVWGNEIKGAEICDDCRTAFLKLKRLIKAFEEGVSDDSCAVTK